MSLGHLRTAPPLRRRRSGVVRVLAATSLLALFTVGLRPGSEYHLLAATTGLTPSSPLQLCGVGDLTSVTAPSQPAPSPSVVVAVTPEMSVSTFAVAKGSIYVLDGLTRIRRFSLTGTPKGAFTLPVPVRHPSLVIAPDGSIVIAGQPNKLVRLSASGHLMWSRWVVGPEISALFGWSSAAGFRIGVVTRRAESALYDLAGNPVGSSPVTGRIFTGTSDGGLLATDGRYVRRYDSSLALGGTFGAAGIANDPQPQGGPFHFYQQGGAVAVGDRVYIADAGRGIEAATVAGLYEGVAADATLGKVAASLGQASPMQVAGDRVFFTNGGRANGSQRVSSISVSDLDALITTPKAPGFVLGFGAGLETGRPGQYFPPGTTPSLFARFDPWWASLSGSVSLSYTVRDRSAVLANTPTAPTVVALPTDPSALDHVSLTVPSATPGVYEVDARLIQAGSTVGATCLHFTVGAAGHRLDLDGLPPGADFGGPTPARGVALADELGTGLFRGAVDWGRLLPDPTGRMNFAPYDAAFAAAALQARERGVTFEVQVGVGGPVERALVSNGTWGTRVGQLVKHFKGVVGAWEAWNEPNNTFGPAPKYVTSVLVPFARAVRRADPAALVVGASTLGVDLRYLDAIGVAGGFASMDVVAIHPYTGHNRSWEEQGTPRVVRSLHSLLARYGADRKPLWDTESAWWSDGPANFYSQADKAARAMLWMRALGISRWNYFTIEGGYGDHGLSYSLIQSDGTVDNYVKPAALALMTVANQTDGRPVIGLVATGIPHTYALDLGSRPGGADRVLAVWSDDLAEQVLVTSDTDAAVMVTDEYGATTPLTLRAGSPKALQVDGSPRYLTAPAAVQLALSPQETYGDNVASAVNGAAASASSSLPSNPADNAIDGIADAADAGNLPAVPAWASAPGDVAPTLTIALPRAIKLRSVLVTTHSLGSTVPGLRDYGVDLRRPDGTWTTVASVRDQFTNRSSLQVFAPTVATAIRINVTSINCGGLAGGLRPWFWEIGGTPPRPEPAVIEEVEAFAAAPTG